jgi:hypothetical protein
MSRKPSTRWAAALAATCLVVCATSWAGDPKQHRKRIQASPLFSEFYLGGEYVIVLRARDVLDPAVVALIERLSRDLLEVTRVRRVESLANRVLFSGGGGNLVASSAAREAENETPREEIATRLKRGSFGRPVVTDDRSRAILYVVRSDLEHGERLLAIARKVAPGLRPAGYDLSLPPAKAGDVRGDPLDQVGAVHVLLTAPEGGSVLDADALACLEKLEAEARSSAPCRPTSILDALRVLHGIVAEEPGPTPSKMEAQTARQLSFLAVMSADPETFPANHDHTRTVMTIPVHHGSDRQRALARRLRAVRCKGYSLSVHPEE